MVEALTIVLAVGVTRGWRSTLLGVAAATLALAAVVAVLGPALTVVPIETLRLLVGGLLLVFGLQWLRKAVLRAGGHKALHDEEAIFAEQRRQALSVAGGSRGPFDGYSFTVAFKGVFLEGMEVVFIVLSFGATQHQTAWAAVGAAAAVVLVGGVGVAVHAPLARVPENTMKFVVGVMLTTFGIFWGGEGAGIHWPGGDLAIVAVLAWVAAVALGLVQALRRRAPGVVVARPAVERVAP
ncbi:MAG: hypothetical protein ACR2NJ_04145 [Acidimicrobiales bacterium]